MIYAPLFIFCIVFFELFVLLRIGNDAMAIFARSQEAMRVLLSPDIADDEKESLMRRGSAEVFKATLQFAGKCLVVGLVLYLLFQSTATLFPDLKEAMLESFFSPVVIAVLTAGTLCYGWARKAILARL